MYKVEALRGIILAVLRFITIFNPERNSFVLHMPIGEY